MGAPSTTEFSTTFRLGDGDPDIIDLHNKVATLQTEIRMLRDSLDRVRPLEHYVWAEAAADTGRHIGSMRKFIGKNIPSTKIDKRPMWTETLKHVNAIPGGYMMEFGVFSGTSLNFFAKNLPLTGYGFDSFEGLPESDGVWEEGCFSMSKLPEVPPHIELVKGWFNESLPAFLKTHDLSDSFLALLHIDCDLYSSTVTVLEHIAPHIRVGTVVLFDEYWNYPGWRNGEFKAWQEFTARTGMEYEHLCYSNHEQVAIKITKV